MTSTGKKRPWVQLSLQAIDPIKTETNPAPAGAAERPQPQGDKEVPTGTADQSTTCHQLVQLTPSQLRGSNETLNNQGERDVP
ncbi:MAG: hypothetical protein [Microviridae sp.]|nr:MAG: hypothetical protein [Microviridae sp.]